MNAAFDLRSRFFPAFEAIRVIWVAVLVGGALGSLARYGVGQLVASTAGRPDPWATAAVNLIGSAAIGLLAGLSASGRWPLAPWLRAFLTVGVLGGFTTFSSLMLDTLTLSSASRTAAAILNIGGQVVLGLAAVWAGYSWGQTGV